MQKRSFKFYHVDVFAERRFGGNPLAVFPDADGLTPEDMQAITFELNLSETTFVFQARRPEAHHWIRVFTPVRELPAAGHPTIGTNFVLARLNRIPLTANPTTIYQEVGMSVMPVHIYSEDGTIGKITMTQEEPRFLDYIGDLEKLAAGLCCEVSDLDLEFASPQVVSTGLPCIMVPVRSIEVLSQLGMDLSSLRDVCEEHHCEMAYAFTLDNTIRDGATAQARFFSGHLLFEDAATGSAAGALGAFLASQGVGDEDGSASEYIIDQGDYIGRPSRIFVKIDREGDKISNVEVSGNCRHVFEGDLTLESRDS